MNYALALPAPALASFMKAIEKYETTPDIAKSTSSSTADSDCSDVFAKVRCLLKKHASSALPSTAEATTVQMEFKYLTKKSKILECCTKINGDCFSK